MGVVDLDNITRHEYELKPVIWVDCPGCGKGLKSTWLLKEDKNCCETCGTIVRFVVVSHFEDELYYNLLSNTEAIHAADQRILRSGNVWIPCQGDCDESLDVGWFIHDHEYDCNECGTHHHVEVVFENIGEPESDQEELCLLCNETTFVELMDTHHISYSPERVVRVCRECHQRIHQEPGYYDEFEPETTPEASVSDLMSHPG